VKMTGLPDPLPHQGYAYTTMWREMKLGDVFEKRDGLQVRTLDTLLKKHFGTLVDIFMHYVTKGDKTQVQGGEIRHKGLPMRKMMLFVRTCRISEKDLSFYQIMHQVLKGVPSETSRDERPGARATATKDEGEADPSDSEFSLAQFVEAVCRLARAKFSNLYALCDQVNRLLHTHVLPYAMAGQDEDPNKIRENLHQPNTWSNVRAHRTSLWRWYRKSIATGTVLTIGQMIDALKKTEQIDADLSEEHAREALVSSLTWEVKPSQEVEDDNVLSIMELLEAFTRLAYMRFQNPEERLENKLELLTKRFLRALGEQGR